jgi:hypothetical protein
MTNLTTPLERAFQLARSGKFSSVSDIRKQLASERFPTEQMSGGTLLRQLRLIIKASDPTKAG